MSQNKQQGYPHLDQGWEYMREQAKAAIEAFQKYRWQKAPTNKE